MTNTQKQRCECLGKITEAEIAHFTQCACPCHDVSMADTQKQEELKTYAIKTDAPLHYRERLPHISCPLCPNEGMHIPGARREDKHMQVAPVPQVEKTYTQSEVDALLEKQEDWEKEFDDTFRVYWSSVGGKIYGVDPSGVNTPIIVEPQGVKSFIRALLAKKEAEMVEKIINTIDIGAMASNTPEARHHMAGWENCKHHILLALSKKD